MPLRLCDDKKEETLSHTVLMSDMDWNPTTLDGSAKECEEWFDAQTEHADGPNSKLFNEFGNCRKRRCANEQ